MNIGVILAGGFSRRMNHSCNLPKQFIEVNGKPVIAYTIENLQSDPLIDHILVAARREHFALVEEIKSKFGLSKIKWLSESGEQRHDSLYNALKYLEGVCKPDDIIVSLSAVAPILSREAFRESIAAARESGAATTAMPLRNTLIVAGEGGAILEIPDRGNFRVITEPHAYRYGVIREAYDRAYSEHYFDASVTDDAQILHHAGFEQVIIDGNTDFIKITFQNDVRVFEQYINECGFGENRC